MFSDCKNSKKKGDAGLGRAIAYFSMKGVPVCIPLTDSQDYDLVVELEGELKKVQVKVTSQRVPNGNFRVGLRVCGGNSKKNFVHKLASDIDYDILFILTEADECYLIPRSAMMGITSELTLGAKYEAHKVL